MSRSHGDDPIPMPRGGRIDVVAALSASGDLPVEALELAVRAPGRLADVVLPLVQAAAEGRPIGERDGNLLFWGIHVLGAARDRRLFAPLMRLLRRTDEESLALIGDTLGGTLPRIVASVFDDESEPLAAALMDREADEYVRWSLFGAYAFLAQMGRIDREAARDLLVRFDTERPARAGDAAWTGWEETIALLGFADLAERVAAAREDARVLDDASDPEWFALTLEEARSSPGDMARFADKDLGYVEDVVAELERALADDDEDEPEEPLRNPLREVGRNDPCPCGSGKKFKKCCLSD